MPPAAGFTVRAQHAAAGATTVAATATEATEGFRLLDTSQAFNPDQRAWAPPVPQGVCSRVPLCAPRVPEPRPRSAPCLGRRDAADCTAPAELGRPSPRGRGACSLRLEAPMPRLGGTRTAASQALGPYLQLSAPNPAGLVRRRAAAPASLRGQPSPRLPGRANFPSDNRSFLTARSHALPGAQKLGAPSPSAAETHRKYGALQRRS